MVIQNKLDIQCLISSRPIYILIHFVHFVSFSSFMYLLLLQL
jgi:hypothetical protein